MNPPTLKQYYQDILRWVESGCPKNSPYLPQFGLCTVNLKKWYWTHTNYRDFPDTKYYLKVLSTQQIRSFIDARLPFAYPFDSGDFSLYLHDSKHNLLYKNPARLDWIRKHAS